MISLLQLVALLMAWLLSFVSRVEIGRSTTFGPFETDPLAGSSFACVLGNRKHGMQGEAAELFRIGSVVASKRHACWELLTLYMLRTGESVRVVVADVGPAKAIVDVWHVLGKRIRHNGQDPVILLADKP